MKIDGIQKKIEIVNNSDKYFVMDVDAAIDIILDFLAPKESEARKIDELYSQIGTEAAKNLTNTVVTTGLSVLGTIVTSGTYVDLNNLAQPIGEGLAGSTTEDIKDLGESLIKVIEARKYLNTTEQLKVE
jgi:hypothetical protein